MIPLPKNTDALHKNWILKTLTALYDSPVIAKHLFFKGGTCAAMQGFIARFSVDLDFDFSGNKNEMLELRKEMERVISDLGLTIADASKHVPQYFLKYPAEPGSFRNTLKIDAAFPPSLSNKYEAVLLPEVERVITCQTRETMFANKLVALINRREKGRIVAGRDVFDVYSFFLKGFDYDANVIMEQRPGIKLVDFFITLENFIKVQVNQDTIDNDLNFLLPPEDFRRVRLSLKQLTLVLIRDEIKRLESNTK